MEFSGAALSLASQVKSIQKSISETLMGLHEKSFDKLHKVCEIQFSSIQFKKINHPTRGNFAVVMAGSLKKQKTKHKVKRTIQ